MINVPVNAKGESRRRAGTQALTLLGVPLNVLVLQTLERGPRALVDLRRETGLPAQTTLRGHLRTLTEIGVLERRRQEEFPGALDYELTESGRQLFLVGEVLQAWLSIAPEGLLSLGSAAAKRAIKALVDGWGTSMLRALAARPLSLTELDSLISGLSYPSLERRLSAMRLAGQIEAVPGRGAGTPYGVTDWMRRAVAPLAAAARWERLYLRHAAAPVSPRDAEAAFLLSIPLIDLPAGLTGSCRLTASLPTSAGTRIAGVMVEVRDGRVISCASRLEGSATAWASGSVGVWLHALIERDPSALETGGDRDLAEALIDGMHDELFGLRAGT